MKRLHSLLAKYAAQNQTLTIGHVIAFTNAMTWLVLLAAVCCLPLIAGRTDDPPLRELQNVNARYTVESVELESPAIQRLSRALRSRVDALVGHNFDPDTVSDLAQRIREEVRRRVTHKIERGASPEYVRIIYFAEGRRLDEDQAELTKLKYHHKQGWTGGVGMGFDVGENRIEFGLQSDADTLLERYAGLNAGLYRRMGERVRAGVAFDAFHQQWNAATIEALASRSDIPGIYRERYSVRPDVTVRLAGPLTWSAGLSFNQVETQFPAARFETSSAFETTLRYKTRWRDSDSFGQELDAGYTLRAATNLLGSDFVYSRHAAHASYAVRRNHHLVTVRGMAGALSGRAPLYDRFSIGNATTLRGWHKFDIDPLGGDRMVHGSAGYRYRAVGVFYDTGAVWEHGKENEDRHSVGVTVALGALRDGPYLTLAFPLRSGAIQPLFIMGMNF